ncbi:MgtC/SapB family protein [Legionella qingyii]|uniref:MgtC/SapB family protein n=1 Tax=Legionella qingyii TaxID=2184757 RepID=UPI000F8E955D|nr:MgtC/SapB family protein [Legionella qingyii]RUR29231.1 MgtC/SapB family protein [Legionella qingyii]
MLEELLFFTISLLIGLLIGIERERGHPEGRQFIGVRNFTLLSMLGTLVAVLQQTTLTIAVSFFVIGILLLNYYQSIINQKKSNSIEILTQITACFIFCLGYMVPTSPFLAITLSAIIFLVLIERQRLHILAREKFKPHEIETVIILVIFTLGILPLLPDRTFDPWHLFNPKEFGLLIATVAAIQLGGYIAIHLFGERLGIPLTGFLGGLVSSTAVFAQLNNTLKRYPGSWNAILASGLLATIAMLVDVLIIILVASPDLFIFIIWPIVAMICSGGLLAVILLHFQKKRVRERILLATPLNLLSIVRTSIIIGLLLLIIAMAKRIIFAKGILLISFLGGLVEIHGVSLATALLYLANQIHIDDARFMVYIAIFASYISKITLVWCFTPARFAFYASMLLLGMLSGGVVIYCIGL